MAPVWMKLKESREVDTRVCLTGQHKEMVQPILDLFRIQPDHDLKLMTEGQTLNGLASKAIAAVDAVLEKENPDWVLVQGDTTTAMAGALAAFSRRVKVGHIEAGLRTFNLREPFPEEANRRICSIVSELHFPPTALSEKNLLAEGIPAERILTTGNTVIDALHWVVRQPYDIGQIPFLAESVRTNRKIILVTAHRRENFGQGIENICLALKELARRHENQITIVYPVHMNPNVKGPVTRLLGSVPNVILTPPLEYQPMVNILMRSAFVLTDSGGLQEEAPGLGKPVLVLRNVTERPEGVETGVVKLVGCDPERIVSEATALLEDPAAYDRMAKAVHPYGDGKASEKILRKLIEYRG